ncbi:uncharacterized membrane protein YhaH (DUF805 family) [Caulobacter ginsengisoli]|uniref:Uncharacterized membrane protein YhaH (DUF805 family) n=1 Tax=Caulobacter ginsengisoli TaxID=400775 RepID=A0ABU0IVF8_9CAUL|nr:DUF4199 domain-containing protein [Caulobacter ginsengisoli]MDQ0466002.1 uncharacterized membrane protein YhaH (DUF805 family) [Caulobacter ginsengisoli]
MLRSILIFGAIAGLISVSPFVYLILTNGSAHSGSVVVGYLTMLVAFSLIFVAVKRHRDRNLGGVIKFLPALGIGLGISLVAGIVYVAVWDIYLNISHFAFVDEYAPVIVKGALAKGATPAEAARQAAEFKTTYMNPLARWPWTLVEILPVGVLVSLVTAGLLRFRQFLPARGIAA